MRRPSTCLEFSRLKRKHSADRLAEYYISDALKYAHIQLPTPSCFLRTKTQHFKWLLVTEEHRYHDQRLQQRRPAIPWGCYLVFHRTQAHVLCPLFNRALHDHWYVDSCELLYPGGKWRANRTVCYHSFGCQRLPACCHWTVAGTVRHAAIDWSLLHCGYVWNRAGVGRYCSGANGSPRHFRATKIYDLFDR